MKRTSPIAKVTLTVDSKTAAVRITLKNKKTKGYSFDTVDGESAGDKADKFISSLRNKDTAETIASYITNN